MQNCFLKQVFCHLYIYSKIIIFTEKVETCYTTHWNKDMA